MELGAEAVDADALAHEALESPEVREVLGEWLGPRAVASNGKVDRSVVASLVFSDPAKLKRLESLVHPHVLAAIESRVQEFERRKQAARAASATEISANAPTIVPTSPVLILDVPLLLSSPLRDRCDAIVYVDAAAATRQQRIAGRGWSHQEIARREALQTPDEEKRRWSTAIIDNSGSLEATRRQVLALYQDWTK